MARNSDWTEAKFKRYLAEGRGQGRKEQYRPWLMVSDIPSRGRSTRIFSHKANRIVHLLTDTQLRYFYLLEWSEAVIDINEQYPCLHIETIQDQLDENLVKRLSDKQTGISHVMLTTFLVTAINDQGMEYQFARTLKDAAELEKKATIERLELQRLYWKSRNVDFGIVTSNEIPVQRSKNIEWVMPALNLEEFGLTKHETIQYAEQLINGISATDNSLNSILNSFDRQMRTEVGTGLLIFRHLIASRRIQIDLDMEMNLERTPSELKVIVHEHRRGGAKHAIGG